MICCGPKLSQIIYHLLSSAHTSRKSSVNTFIDDGPDRHLIAPHTNLLYLCRLAADPEDENWAAEMSEQSHSPSQHNQHNIYKLVLCNSGNSAFLRILLRNLDVIAACNVNCLFWVESWLEISINIGFYASSCDDTLVLGWPRSLAGNQSLSVFIGNCCQS